MSHKQKTGPQAKAQTILKQQINNFMTICALTLGMVFTFLALISYHATDPSVCFATTAPTITSNWLGQWGALWSSILLYFFGSSAFIIPGIFFFVLKVHLSRIIAPTFKGTKEAQSFKKESAWKNSIDRLVAFILLLPLSSTIAHVYTWEPFSGIYPGGTCGFFFNRALALFLDEPLIHLFLFMITWATLVVITRFSFITYLYPIAHLVSKIPIKALFNQLRIGVKQYLFKKRETTDQIIQDIPQTVFQEPPWHDSPKQRSESLTPAYEDTHENDIELQAATVDEKTLTQLSIEKSGHTPGGPFKVPSSSLFPQPKEHAMQNGPETPPTDAQQRAATLEHKLERFGIKGKVVSITQGPVVTLFEYQPSIDTKISTIVAREDDLALALQALSLRIIAPIPGRSVLGFEVAHAKRRAVLFWHLLKSEAFTTFSGSLPLILGKDTLGNDVVIDLATMPHLLVAGSTGSGKSVGLHTMIMSLLCSKTPDEIKFILIDPKRLEFAAYADIPHLLFPIVTDPARACAVLKWAVATMEDRYAAMAQVGVRNAAEYNNRLDPSSEAYFPLIIIIIDELADLMMTAGKDVETLIARLAQMARAAGIHLIVATQRPSVDVITGLIKVNFPSRIAYKVTSKVDSRTILDTMGAEKLLGKGDMLFLDAKGVIIRVHGAYVTDTEISLAVQYTKAQRAVTYTELISLKNEDTTDDGDELLQDVIEYVKSKDEVSISLIQRVFRIGYNRSARIMDQLESSGYILPSDGAKMRKVHKD